VQGGRTSTSISRKLVQTADEWSVRNAALGAALADLINHYVEIADGYGIEVGCQNGRIIDELIDRTRLKWVGVDPVIHEPSQSPRHHAPLMNGIAHDIPFLDDYFDCVVLANVYEHVAPELRDASLLEMSRVLRPGGLLVGQLPNPYFPIESHSRLPFMGFLPYRLQLLYWRLSPVDWDHDFYVVTVRELRRRAERIGFETVVIRNFNYPITAIPQPLRRAARVFAKAMDVFPWSWQFIFRTPTPIDVSPTRQPVETAPPTAGGRASSVTLAPQRMIRARRHPGLMLE
jgi:SAM-dependent methyltransferase